MDVNVNVIQAIALKTERNVKNNKSIRMKSFNIEVIVECFDEDALADIIGGKQVSKRRCKCNCTRTNCYGDESSKPADNTAIASPSSCEAGNCYRNKQ